MKKYIVILLIVSNVFTACAPNPTQRADPPNATPSATLTMVSLATETPWDLIIPTRTKAPTKTPLAPASLDVIRPGQLAYTYEANSGVILNYWMYIPEDFDPTQKWPLILELHGSEERGITIDRLSSEVIKARNDLPFIVVTPQLDSGFWNKRFPDLNELLDHLVETLSADPDRLYLTGLSLGGFGTWQYAYEYPDRFAAIAPIAGGFEGEIPEDVCKLKDLPIWAFHGEEDTQVEPRYSQTTIDALRACGGEPKFTLYPGASHVSSWQNAYADPTLYEWFLTHTN